MNVRRVNVRPYVFALTLLSVVMALVPLTAPPAPAAPAPAAGCAGCHVAGKAPTLDAGLKKIKNHPQLPAPTVAMCAGCHKTGGAAPSLGPVLHKRHLGATAFTATYKGTCTSCHAVDLKTGKVTVVGLPPR